MLKLVVLNKDTTLRLLIFFQGVKIAQVGRHSLLLFWCCLVIGFFWTTPAIFPVFRRSFTKASRTWLTSVKAGSPLIENCLQCGGERRNRSIGHKWISLKTSCSNSHLAFSQRSKRISDSHWALASTFPRLILRIFFLQDCPANLKNGKYYVSYALFTLAITKITKVAKVVYKYFIAFNTHLPIKIFSPYFVDLFSWFLRVKPPQIVTFSLPTRPRKNIFRPPKFQHKKFAILIWSNLTIMAHIMG